MTKFTKQVLASILAVCLTLGGSVYGTYRYTRTDTQASVVQDLTTLCMSGPIILHGPNNQTFACAPIQQQRDDRPARPGLGDV